jgi:hypothetical protein
MIPLLLLPLALLAPIAPSSAQTSIESAPLVMPFSAGPAGAPHPAGWEIVRLTDNKRLTAYDLVDDHGVIVLHARADAAASALGHHTAFDIRAAPIVQWRWRVGTAIEAADNAVAAREDSPVRLIFEFDGNKSALSLAERAVFLVSRAASGRELPYATLMYVWSGVHPVGMVIPNPRTRRIEMIVASSGTGEIGKWQTLKRNLNDDFQRAFGERPGRLTAVGVLTDTDNTKSSAEAWYGDIRFLPMPD